MTSELRLRPAVDREECFGFGYCVEHAPEVFALDETGHAVVIGLAVDEERLKLAAGDCPRGAIDLVPVPGSGGTQPQP